MCNYVSILIKFSLNFVKGIRIFLIIMKTTILQLAIFTVSRSCSVNKALQLLEKV